MKQATRFAVGVLCLCLMSVASAIAQDQYTEGGVTRVTLVQILPGHFNAFMDDLKTNIKPIWEAEKKAGLAGHPSSIVEKSLHSKPILRRDLA